jgi:hypothetical protein
MDRKRLLSIAASAAVIFMAIGPAQANPATSAPNGFKKLVAEQEIVSKAALVCTSRCWRHAGRRVCKRSCTGVRTDDLDNRPVDRPGYRPLK